MIDLSTLLGGLVGLVRGGRMVVFGLALLSQSGGYRVCPVLGLHRFWRSVPTYLTGKGPIGPCGYAMGVASGETGLQARLLGLLQNVKQEDDSMAVPKLGSGLRLRGLTSSSSKGAALFSNAATKRAGRIRREPLSVIVAVVAVVVVVER